MAAKEVEEVALPNLEDGEFVEVVEVEMLTKKTKPPAPYNEGSLLSDMENAGKYLEDKALAKMLKKTAGLGTAATRAEIIESLKHDKYVVVKTKSIEPTEKGMKFIQWLDTVSPSLVDVGLTAMWETELAVVAEKGGGTDLERRIFDELGKQVATLKTAPTLGLASTKKDVNTVSENEGSGRASKPTEKMVEYATRIAAKVLKDYAKSEEYQAAIADFDACKKFIDKYKEQANKPTDKQVQYAQRISKEAGVAIPDEALKDGRALSQWIDENKPA